jgi:hypothetical protein
MRMANFTLNRNGDDLHHHHLQKDNDCHLQLEELKRLIFFIINCYIIYVCREIESGAHLGLERDVDDHHHHLQNKMMIAISTLKKWGWLAFLVIYAYIIYMCREIESGVPPRFLYR